MAISVKNTISDNILLFSNWLPCHEADNLFFQSRSLINWQQEFMNVYGKKVAFPRLTAWYGDKNLVYKYSGVTHKAIGWPKALYLLKEKINGEMKLHFNSVLCNLYRDGQDSIGWHVDNEKALGDDPIIASISLGQSRNFKLKNKKTGSIKTIILPNGSLLMMGKGVQKNWLHCVPKTKKNCGPRINLTYRTILENDEID